MSVTVRALKRVFKFNQLALPDPGATFTPDQVRDLYAATYSELTNAVIEGPKTTARGLEYAFAVAIGTKGAGDGTATRIIP